MADSTAPKTKRKAQGPRPLFVAIQMLDEDGSPMEFSKERIRIIAASRNAGEILDVMDGGQYPHATYKKVVTAV